MNKAEAQTEAATYREPGELILQYWVTDKTYYWAWVNDYAEYIIAEASRTLGEAADFAEHKSLML